MPHAPAPWILIGQPKARAIHDATGRIVLDELDGTTPTHADDWRLIALAPELLAILKVWAGVMRLIPDSLIVRVAVLARTQALLDQIEGRS